MKIVIVSGGFDPLHRGHIEYLKDASALGTYVFLGLNSDAWLIRKKGQYFLSWEERQSILENLWMVDRICPFNDEDDTALDLLRTIRKQYPDHHLIVANGGDRTPLNNAEESFAEEDQNCEFVFGVGGETKLNSSSLILKRWKDLS